MHGTVSLLQENPRAHRDNEKKQVEGLKEPHLWKMFNIRYSAAKRGIIMIQSNSFGRNYTHLRNINTILFKIRSGHTSKIYADELETVVVSLHIVPRATMPQSLCRNLYLLGGQCLIFRN